MPQRQQLLMLYTNYADLTTGVGAWSFYDGTGQQAHPTHGDNTKPPYNTVIEAMKDGWRVIQLPQLIPAYPGTEYTTSFLKFEVILERMVEVAADKAK